MPLVRAAVAALTWPISLFGFSVLLLLMILEENSTAGLGGGEGALGGLLGNCLMGASVTFFSNFSSSCVASLMVSFDNIFFCFNLISSISCKNKKSSDKGNINVTVLIAEYYSQ